MKRIYKIRKICGVDRSPKGNGSFAMVKTVSYELTIDGKKTGSFRKQSHAKDVLSQMKLSEPNTIFVKAV